MTAMTPEALHEAMREAMADGDLVPGRLGV